MLSFGSSTTVINGRSRIKSHQAKPVNAATDDVNGSSTNAGQNDQHNQTCDAQNQAKTVSKTIGEFVSK